MNEYTKILKSEVEKIYGTNSVVFGKFQSYAKAIVSGKKAKMQKPEYNTPEENRLYTLAVVAELAKTGQVTMNLSQVPSEITEKDLFVLADEYLIQLYRVAQPYQLVFLK